MIGSGSGFVAFDNRTLVTNYHVMDGASWMAALSDTGEIYLVTNVIAADEEKDIALLEFFSPTDLTPLTLFEGGGLLRAEPVVAIGSPQGVTNAVSMGNISALYENDGVSIIQFTAPISHGSSGGALFNEAGEVIGVTSGGFSDSQNMNLAVHISEVADLFGQSAQRPRTLIGEYARGAAAPPPALTPTPAPVKEIELQAMWTYEGVVLRWERDPAALGYAVYRWIGDGKAEYVADVDRSLTYYLDVDAALEDRETGYMLVVQQSGDWENSGFSTFATVVPPFRKSTLLPPPDGLVAHAGEALTELAWQGVTGADAYIVYRWDEQWARYEQLSWAMDTSFTDFGAVPGTVCYYTVRSMMGDTISELSQHVKVRVPDAAPAPKRGNEPECTLAISGDGFVDTYRGYPCILPCLVNKSATEAVIGFTISFYCKDEDMQTVRHRDTGDIFYVQRFDSAVGPGRRVYPSYAWLYGYEDVKYVYVSVASIVYANGREVVIPLNEQVFLYWAAQ